QCLHQLAHACSSFSSDVPTMPHPPPTHDPTSVTRQMLGSERGRTRDQGEGVQGQGRDHSRYLPPPVCPEPRPCALRPSAPRRCLPSWRPSPPPSPELPPCVPTALPASPSPRARKCSRPRPWLPPRTRWPPRSPWTPCAAAAAPWMPPSPPMPPSA